MRILELFCGTKSISNVFTAHGWETFTVDNNPVFEPDLCTDINNLYACQIWDEFPLIDVIWASPPCTCFSVASIGTHWTGGKGAYAPATKEAEQSIKLVDRTISIIYALRPRYWFIENPRGVLRKMEFMKELPIRHTITYCQYGDTRMKPTDIWTNCTTWEPRPACKNGDLCHTPAPRGSKTGTQGLKGSIERSRIPQELCEEIYQSVNI